MQSYYRKILVKKLSTALYFTGVHSLTRPFYSGLGQILMFHRVIPAKTTPRINNHLSLEISPQHLKDILYHYEREGYVPISLDDLPDWLKEKQKRKFVIYTFDDGYKDNLDYAYPIFRQFKAPVTIYVTSIFPEKQVILWWYILEDILLQNNRLKFHFPAGKIDLVTSTQKQKQMAFTRIREMIIRLDEDNLAPVLTDFFNGYGHDPYSLNDKLAMSWDEVRQLSDQPEATIGAHTVHHYNLTQLSDEKARTEIAESKSQIEKQIGKKVDHFSYPLGFFTDREKRYAEEAHFKTACTTRISNIFQAHADQMYNLPRFSINVLSTPHVLKLQSAGFFHAVTRLMPAR